MYIVASSCKNCRKGTFISQLDHFAFYGSTSWPTISNLFSYDQINENSEDNSESTSFSKINAIVGPNDSGKSNIFRAIKLLVNSIKFDSAITDSEVFSNQATSKLDAELLLSDSEAGVLFWIT